MKITPGSIVSGKSGKTFLVERIEEDIIYSGKAKFLTSAVLKVIPPRPKAFKAGDKVEYIGSDSNLKIQYAGILEIRTTLKDVCSCYAPNRERVTSWIEYSDLGLAGQTIDGDYFSL